MINPMEIIQFMKSGGNPQQMISQFLQQNPQMQSVMNGVNFHDKNAMEQICRNICVQKGIDFDTMVSQFNQNGGNLN